MNTFKPSNRWRRACPESCRRVQSLTLRSSRTPVTFQHRTGLVMFLAALVFTTPSFAHDEKPGSGLLEGVALVERLGAQLPLNTSWRDETGATVRLGQYFTGKPVLL